MSSPHKNDAQHNQNISDATLNQNSVEMNIYSTSLSPSPSIMSQASSSSAYSNYTLQGELTEFRQSEMLTEFYPGAERIEYDYAAERQYTHSTNLVESTSHFVKGCLGAGVLGIHEAYMYGGLWTSLGSTFIIGLFVYCTEMMLVRSAQKIYVRIRIPKLSYPDLAEAAVATGPIKSLRNYSKTFRYTLDICLVVELCFSCSIYIVVIAITLKKLLQAIFMTVDMWDLSIEFYILIVTIPLIMVSLVRDMKYLALFSLVADVFVTVCVLITIYYSIAQNSNINDRPGWKNLSGFFNFCGICLYSIEGIGMVMPIENHMKQPKFFRVVLNYGMTIVVIYVSIVGFFGYWGWGEYCHTPINTHMPLSTPVIIFELLLCAMLMVTFALTFLVPFRIIWHYIGRRIKKNRLTYERIFRVGHVILISCFALACPNLNTLMSVLGSFLACVSFVFPSVIETLVYWKEGIGQNRLKVILAKNTFLTLLGIVFCFGGLYSNFTMVKNEE